MVGVTSIEQVEMGKRNRGRSNSLSRVEGETNSVPMQSQLKTSSSAAEMLARRYTNHHPQAGTERPAHKKVQQSSVHAHKTSEVQGSTLSTTLVEANEPDCITSTPVRLGISLV